MSEAVSQAPKAHLRDYPINAGMLAIILVPLVIALYGMVIRLDSRMDTLGEQLTVVRVAQGVAAEQIKSFEARLTARMDTQDARQAARAEALDAKQTARAETLDAKQTARAEGLEKRLDAFDSKLDRVLGLVGKRP